MILIAGELRMKDHWDVLLSVILICFQSPILTIQEITVQDRKLVDFFHKETIENSFVPTKIHLNALDSNGKSAAKVHSMLLMKILVQLLKNGLKLIPNQFELNSVNLF